MAGLLFHRGSKIGSVSYIKSDFKLGPNHVVELIFYACVPTLRSVSKRSSSRALGVAIMNRLRTWLSRKLKSGFWFPCVVCALKYLYEKFSLGYRFKVWLSVDSESLRGASELYQACWLFVALVWICFIWFPSEMLSGAWVKYMGVIIVGYRVSEIVLFALHWVFVSEMERLHGIRRSLAGFILNMIEIALYISIVVILMGCEVQAESQWEVFYNHLSATFGLSLPLTAKLTSCRVVAHAQLVISAVLLSIVIASLVSGILRKEKHESA